MSEATESARAKVIEDVATGISSVTTDGMTVTSMSPKQRLDALREEERREQSQSGNSPFRLTPFWSKGI